MSWGLALACYGFACQAAGVVLVAVAAWRDHRKSEHPLLPALVWIGLLVTSLGTWAVLLGLLAAAIIAASTKGTP